MARHPLTSTNSPLQIAQVLSPPAGGGRIGITLCPGKWQARSVSGNWQRDMDTDLQAIRQWGAAAVVTLMPHDELVACQAGHIGAACEQQGMEWYHLPIQDVNVPTPEFETAWLYAGLRLREHLRQGRHVLVHCRGGLGRSGTIAARLLAELGREPDEAVEAVRAARPGAIETLQQKQHVLQTVRQPDGGSHTARVLGCILGGAVGDAFGYAVEFDRWDRIRQTHGPEGLREPVPDRLGRLVVSDDTQMTLFTLEALTLALPTQMPPPFTKNLLRPFQAACRQAYLHWGDTQGVNLPGGMTGNGPLAELCRSPALRQQRAPGNTCLSAVRAGALGTTENPVNQSKGCGAVMRTAPLGLIDTDPACAQALGDAAGALTHGHLDGWLPGGVLSAMVRRLLQGADIASAAQHTLRQLARHPHPDPVAVQRSGTLRLAQTALRLLQEKDHSRYEVFTLLGEGWTGDEALAIGLYAAGAAHSFEDAVRLGANHDGDSDSTASIAGQLYGAQHGITAVPHAWVRRLDVLPEALRVLQRFLAASMAARRGATDRLAQTQDA